MLNSLPENLFINTKIGLFKIFIFFFPIQHLPFIFPTQIHKPDQAGDF